MGGGSQRRQGLRPVARPRARAALRRPRPGADHRFPRRAGRAGRPPHGQPVARGRVSRIPAEVSRAGVIRFSQRAVVAKLADAPDLGSGSREGVEVQVLSAAPERPSPARGQAPSYSRQRELSYELFSALAASAPGSLRLHRRRRNSPGTGAAGPRLARCLRRVALPVAQFKTPSITLNRRELPAGLVRNLSVMPAARVSCRRLPGIAHMRTGREQVVVLQPFPPVRARAGARRALCVVPGEHTRKA